MEGFLATSDDDLVGGRSRPGECAMQVIIRPVANPEREIDLTERLVSAIAEELWRLYGGNEQLNWLEAERHLTQIVGHAKRKARRTRAHEPRAGRVPARPAKRAGAAAARRSLGLAG
jgi:hypothetical protein